MSAEVSAAHKQTLPPNNLSSADWAPIQAAAASAAHAGMAAWYDHDLQRTTDACHRQNVALLPLDTLSRSWITCHLHVSARLHPPGWAASGTRCSPKQPAAPQPATGGGPPRAAEPSAGGCKQASGCSITTTSNAWSVCRETKIASRWLRQHDRHMQRQGAGTTAEKR